LKIYSKEDGTDGADVVDSLTNSEDKTFDLQGIDDDLFKLYDSSVMDFHYQLIDSVEIKL